MATYTLSINEKSDKAKNFLKFLEDYARDNRFVHIEKMPNRETKKAIEDARNGKLHKANSVEELFNSIE